jgi:plastocyanin
MKYIIFSIVTLLVLATILPVYAETFDVIINVNSHTNSCLPNCIEPEFIKINLSDTVKWINVEFCNEEDSTTWGACSRNYSFVSGNPVDGMDGQFDSGIFRPGESKSITFNKEGKYDYYDPGHPWLQGSIVVGTVTIEKEVNVPVEIEVITENGTETKIITETKIETIEIDSNFEQKPERPVINDSLLQSLYPDRVGDIKEIINVGLNVNADDVHTVKYIFHETIGNSQINMNGNGNTLEFSFREPITGNLVLKMPNALIGETLIVIQDEEKILEHTYTQHGEFSIVEVYINEPTRVLTFEATYVTPEYLDIFILGAVIIAVICISIYSKRKQPMLIIKA